jgi:prepilin-type N-terminal cleavage/methylation domain-containing protein
MLRLPSFLSRGFSLVELAMVLFIVGILMLSLMSTLSSQAEQRNFDETRRRLEQARELVLSFAVVNGRLPCPARSAATTSPVTIAGAEVLTTATGCVGDSITDNYGGVSGAVTLGLLPARTIGFQQVDSSGFAVDAWGNRIRYAVARTVLSSTCTVTPTNPHWVNATNLKANGIACQPDDLLICKSASVTPALSATSCGGTPAGANQIMGQNLVVVIIFSTGKNGALTCATCTDEAANRNGAGNVDPIFVFHPPASSAATGGEFDDQFVWITVGEFYGKLIAAGVLP